MGMRSQVCSSALVWNSASLPPAPDVAEKSVEGALGQHGGLDKDARLNMEGFRNLLALRAELIGGLSDIRPEKYLDLSYYERAVADMP